MNSRGMYTHSGFRRRSPRRVKPILTTFSLAIVCAGLFVYGIYHFRFEKKEVENTAIRATDAEVAGTLVSIPGSTGKDREAELVDVSGGSASGVAIRSTSDDRFSHSVKAVLPEIDREAFFYEGWLLRKVPFDFFSTGEMVTNSLGEFVLEWEGPLGENFNDYTKVVITLEARDGNPDPAQHILEGEFTH